MCLETTKTMIQWYGMPADTETLGEKFQNKPKFSPGYKVQVKSAHHLWDALMWASNNSIGCFGFVLVKYEADDKIGPIWAITFEKPEDRTSFLMFSDVGGPMISI